MKFKLNKLLIFKLGIAHVINARLMYNNLKKDDYARSRTTILGKRGFRHILFFALFMAFAIFSFYKMASYLMTGQIFIMILALIAGIYTVAYGILFLPLALNLTIKQLKLNKKAIGWINLILLILIILAFIALILFLKFS